MRNICCESPVFNPCGVVCILVKGPGLRPGLIILKFFRLQDNLADYSTSGCQFPLPDYPCQFQALLLQLSYLHIFYDGFRRQDKGCIIFFPPGVVF